MYTIGICARQKMLLNLLYIFLKGFFLIGLIRRLHIQHIIVVFFLPDAEIESEINTEPAGVPLPETAGIHRTLPDCEIILIGPENIIHTDGDSQLLLKEPAVDTAVELAKAGKFIKLLLPSKSKKPVEGKCGFFIQF